MRKMISVFLAFSMTLSLVACAGSAAVGDPAATESTMEKKPASVAETTMNEELTDAAESFSEKDIPVLREELDSTETATVRYYEDLPNVPYMSVTDFYNQFELAGTDLKEGISFTQSDGQYTITTFNGDIAVFDVNADTMYFDNLDKFITLAHDHQSADAGGVDEDYPFVKTVDTTEPEKATPKTLSLSDYNIDLRGDETGVYVPLPTLTDLFATTSNYFVVFSGEKLYVKDVLGNLQEDSAIYYDEDYITAIKADHPDDFAEYTYNELCFDTDLWYGKPGQEFIHEDLINRKLDDVLTEKYPEIKQMLLSKDFENYFAGLNNIYYGLLSDGGHTSLNAADVQMSDLDLSQKIINELKAKEYGGNYDFFVNVKGDHLEMREEVREPIYKEDYYIESGDTAMIRFDHFEVDNDGWKDFYAGKGERPLEDDSFGTVLSGIERASKNPEIKNIVIDISCCGGGDDTALLAIECLLCGTGYIRDINMFTDQINKQTADIDINFDGVFDDKDVSSYKDYNYGILTSDYSFSCANAFPWFMHEHGAMILGQKSSGGACATRNSAVGGVCVRVSAASNITITEDGESVDSGCPVDADLTTEGENPYENFYDLSLISEKMNEYYTH